MSLECDICHHPATHIGAEVNWPAIPSSVHLSCAFHCGIGYVNGWLEINSPEAKPLLAQKVMQELNPADDDIPF